MQNKVIQTSNIKSKKEKDSSKNEFALINSILSNNIELSKHKSHEIYGQYSPSNLSKSNNNNNPSLNNNQKKNNTLANTIKKIILIITTKILYQIIYLKKILMREKVSEKKKKMK